MRKRDRGIRVDLLEDGNFRILKMGHFSAGIGSQEIIMTSKHLKDLLDQKDVVLLANGDYKISASKQRKEMVLTPGDFESMLAQGNKFMEDKENGEA